MLENGHREDRLLDYLYGELPEKEAREVEALLARDEEAARELSRLREVRETMAKLPPERPRESVLEAIRKRAHQLAPQPPPKRNAFLAFILRPSFAGAFVFLLVLAVGLYISRYGSEPEPGPKADRAPVSRFVPPPASTPTIVAAKPMAPKSPEPTSAAAAGEHEADGPQVARRGLAKDERRRGHRRRARRRRAPRIVARVARPTPQTLFPKKSAQRRAPLKLARRSADPAPLDATRLEGAGRFGILGKGAGGGTGKALEDKEQSKNALSGVRVVARAYRAPQPKPSTPTMAQGYLPKKEPLRLARNNRDVLSEMGTSMEANAPAAAQQAARPSPAPAAAPPPPPPAEVGGLAGGKVQPSSGDQVARRGEEQAPRGRVSANRQTSATTTAAPPSLQKARRELAQGKVDAAIATLKKLLRVLPSRASRDAYRLLAQAYERRGDRKLAARTRAAAETRFAPARMKNKAKTKATRARPATNAATKSY